MRYRADVDGLRALAIVLVVAFHVHVPGFSGGFVGVDVFFVISGFLITGLLSDELESRRRISLVNFYARRIRRLLPALFVVSVVTLVIGAFVLLPDPELRWLGQSVFAVAFFASNFFFWIKTGDYFDPASELQPLLNTWSLAVEEQFYFVWPLFLWGVWWLSARVRRFRPPAIQISLIGATIVLSFVVSAITVRSDQPAAFFLLPSRLWELAVGAALALLLKREYSVRPSVRTAMSVVGLAAIAGSVLWLDAESTFPGPSALPVVVGTALVVASGSIGSSVVARVLSSGALVGLGKLSYSWYLIHWPLLVFARIVWLGPDLTRDIAIGLGSLGLAWLLYTFVEQPVRLQRLPFVAGRRQTLAFGAAAVMLLGATGLLVGRESARFSRLDLTPSEEAALTENRTARDACPNLPLGSDEAVDCSFDVGDNGVLALVGDSHALAVLPAAIDIATELDMRLEMLWTTGCPFTVEYESPDGEGELSEGCVRENQIRMQYLVGNADRIDTVLITGRATSYVNRPDSTAADAASSAWEKSFAATLDDLVDAGIDPVVMHDVPRFRFDVPQCLIRKTAAECAISIEEASNHRAPAMRAEVAASTAAGVLAWDPFDRLCSGGVCFTNDGDDVLYRDIDHLSEAGARFITPGLLEVIRQVTQDAGVGQ